MISKGVLVDYFSLGIQLVLINYLWVVKKPANVHLSWDQFQEQHIKMVTAFNALDKFLNN